MSRTARPALPARSAPSAPSTPTPVSPPALHRAEHGHDPARDLPLGDLRRLVVAGPLDVAIFAKAFAVRQAPGDALSIMIDGARCFVDLLPVVDGEDYLDLLVALATVRDDVDAVVLLTGSDDDPPGAGGDHERRWEELKALDDDGVLVDWLVVSRHRWVWSVAEHARVPAAW